MSTGRLSRILMTADTVGGVWTFAIELCRGLQQRGVPVTLATMGRGLSPAERGAARKIPDLELYESDYKLEWMEDPWDDVKASGDWLLDLSERTSAALIHLNGYCHAALEWGAPCLVVGHSCVASWFEAVKGRPPPPEWEHYREKVAAGLRAADLVTAPSQTMLAALKVHYGDFAAADPVYNGRDPAGFLPAAKEPFVLTVGRLWDEAKNVAALGRVAEEVVWPIYAAGDCSGPDGRLSDFRSLRPLGRLDAAELAGWYRRASIFVLPARYEPFGFTALEAALAGCALVLGNIASLREIWRGAALFADPDDPAAISTAVATLIECAPLRRSLARRALARAMFFSPGRMVEGYLKLYGKIISPTGRRRRRPRRTGSTELTS